MTAPNAEKALREGLHTLRSPGFQQDWQDVARTAETKGWTFGQYLQHWVDLRLQEGDMRRVERAKKASRLPSAKTVETLDRSLLPPSAQRTLATLCVPATSSAAERICWSSDCQGAANLTSSAP